MTLVVYAEEECDHSNEHENEQRKETETFKEVRQSSRREMQFSTRDDAVLEKQRFIWFYKTVMGEGQKCMKIENT